MFRQFEKAQTAVEVVAALCKRKKKEKVNGCITSASAEIKREERKGRALVCVGEWGVCVCVRERERRRGI